MSKEDNGGPIARDVKWIMGTIVATGIGVVLVVSSLTRHEVTHVWRATQDHERRVNDSASGVILEFQRLLRTLQDDRRERMGDIEDGLNGVRRSLDALRDSPHGRAHGLTEILNRIEHELREIRRLVDPDDSAESSVETPDDAAEPSIEQTTGQDPEAR